MTTRHLAFAVGALLVVSPTYSAYANTADAVTERSLNLTSSELPLGNIDSEGGNYVFNIRSCREYMGLDSRVLTFRWAFELGFQPVDDTYSVKLQRPGGACVETDTDVSAEEELGDCFQVASPASASNAVSIGSVEVDIENFNYLFNTLTSADDCSTPGDEVVTGDSDMLLIFPKRDSLDAPDIELEADRIRVSLDLTRPGAPTLSDVVTGENSMRVEWTEASVSGLDYRVYYSQTPFLAGEYPELVQAADSGMTRSSAEGGSSRTIEGNFELNANYYVAVVSEDTDGNESVFSEVLEVQTTPTTDFWEYYREQGGLEAGGCSHAGREHGGVLGFILLGLLGLRRKEQE